MQTINSTQHLQIEPSVLYFGTPVSLISTLNPDGSANLAPMSSTWYLGRTAVLGIADGGQTLPNLRRAGECVLNLPSSDMHDAVERLAPLTGRRDVPPHKQDRFRYEKDKFAAAGLSQLPSTTVAPPRVLECPVHLEAVVEQTHSPAEGGFAIVEVRVTQVHVTADCVIPGTHYVDTEAWQPLFYLFRHYFGTGPRLSRSFRAEH